MVGKINIASSFGGVDNGLPKKAISSVRGSQDTDASNNSDKKGTNAGDIAKAIDKAEAEKQVTEESDKAQAIKIRKGIVDVSKAASPKNEQVESLNASQVTQDWNGVGAKKIDNNFANKNNQDNSSGNQSGSGSQSGSNSDQNQGDRKFIANDNLKVINPDEVNSQGDQEYNAGVKDPSRNDSILGKQFDSSPEAMAKEYGFGLPGEQQAGSGAAQTQLGSNQGSSSQTNGGSGTFINNGIIGSNSGNTVVVNGGGFGGGANPIIEEIHRNDDTTGFANAKPSTTMLPFDDEE